MISSNARGAAGGGVANGSPASVRGVPAADLLTSRSAFLVALVFRLIAAVFLLRSSDAPDEWYQSVEVAYSVVFGKSELTWEWREGIRSFLYPAPMAGAFAVLRFLGLDSAWAVFVVPRVYAALICAATDWATWWVARRYLHPAAPAATMAFLLSLTSWYNLFIGCRTLTNSVEALMILAAMMPESIHGFFFFAGLGCGMRATFALPLIPNLLERVRAMIDEEVWGDKKRTAAANGGNVYLHPTILDHHRERGSSPSLPPSRSGFQQRAYARAAVRVIVRVAAVGIAWLVFWFGLIAAVDYVFYKRWICTPYAFLHFNVFRGLSALFGVEPWWWYLPLLPLIVATPLVMFVGLPAALRVPARGPQAAAARRHNFFMRLLVATVVVLVASYSALPHKELRFLYPAVPLLLLLAAGSFSHSALIFKWQLYVVQLTMVVFVGFAIATCFFYQQGAYSSMAYLRGEQQQQHDGMPHAVHMLGPCHWSPSYSAVHGVVTEFVHNNCSIEVDPSTPPGGPKQRLPTEHHLWIDYPLEFVRYVYDGVDPAEVRPLAAAQQNDPRFARGELPSALVAPSPPIDAAAYGRRSVADLSSAAKAKQQEARALAFRRFAKDPPMWFDVMPADMPRVIRTRLQPRSRKLPERFIIFSTYAEWIERHFLEPHGYEREASFMHMVVEPWSPGEGKTVEIWKRRT